MVSDPVNDAPILTVPGAQTVNEDTDLSFNGNLITIADVDAESLQVTLAAGHGSLSLGSDTGFSSITGNGTDQLSFTGSVTDINTALNSLVYRGDLNYNGADTINVGVNDLGSTGGGNLVANNNISINLNPVNDAPTVNEVLKTGNEDTTVTFTASDFTGSFRDIESNSLTKIQLTSLPGNGTLTLSGKNVTADQEIAVANLDNLSFTPAANFNGNISFNWNGFDGTSYAAKESTVNLTLNPVNDAPTLNSISKTGNEDTAIAFTASDFAGSFSDIDPDTLTKIQITSLPENGTLTFNGLDIAANQEIAVDDLAQLSFTPNANFNGNISFNWNGFDGTSYATDGATVNLNVFAVNDAPTLNNISKTGDEDTAIAFTAADFINSFSDVVEGDPLTQIQITSLPENGTLILNGNNVTANQEIAVDDLAQLSFTPNANFNGNISFNWNGFDGTSYATDGATVNLNVFAVNDAPVVNSEDRTTPRAQPITISRADLLGNNIDIDGDSLSISNFSSPSNGTLVDKGDGTFTYTPNIYFDGTDSFTYTIDDAQGGTANSLVNLTVNTEDGIFNQVQLSQFLNTRDITNRDLNSLIFDEGFYLEHNPDVAQAVAAGMLQSGFDHFLSSGQAEGRNPSVLFDEGYYLTNNQDVADAVKAGALSSGYDHFLRSGIFEGRNPSRLFDNNRYLADNQDVDLALKDGALRSGFEHFLRSGQFEDRQPKLELFDEDFYLDNNQDVATAVANGQLSSGFEHFIRSGQVEGRNPSELFDEAFYLKNNSDVADAVARGALRSGFEHFIRSGRAEGRSAVG